MESIPNYFTSLEQKIIYCLNLIIQPPAYSPPLEWKSNTWSIDTSTPTCRSNDGTQYKTVNIWLTGNHITEKIGKETINILFNNQRLCLLNSNTYFYTKNSSNLNKLLSMVRVHDDYKSVFKNGFVFSQQGNTVFYLLYDVGTVAMFKFHQQAPDNLLNWRFISPPATLQLRQNPPASPLYPLPQRHKSISKVRVNKNGDCYTASIVGGKYEYLKIKYQ